MPYSFERFRKFARVIIAECSCDLGHTAACILQKDAGGLHPVGFHVLINGAAINGFEAELHGSLRNAELPGKLSQCVMVTEILYHCIVYRPDSRDLTAGEKLPLFREGLLR